MKKLLMLILLILSGLIYSQQQQHIPWPSLADSPWPNTRGDAQATGRSKYVGPRTPNVIWTKDMPYGILHGPVVGYNDDLFVGTFAFRGFTGDTTNFFYALDKNGENIWSFETDDPHANIAGPSISTDGTIYFFSVFPSGLYAINPNGTLKWNNKDYSATYFTRYVSIAKNHNIYIPRTDTLFVIDSENGDLLDSIFIPNILGKEIVFSTGGDTIFYISGEVNAPGAINAATLDGTFLWSHPFVIINWGVPVVDNENRVYVHGAESQTERYLYCFNKDGTINWKYPLDSSEHFENYSSPTIDRNGNIIFPSSLYKSPSDSGYITSLDYYGNLNWRTSLGHYWDDGAFINSGLVCDAEGKIYCGSSLGTNTNFWCLDSNGTILWKLDLEGYEYDTSPAINSEGTLYIGTHLGSLFQNHERNLIAINDTVTSVENNDNDIFNFRLEQNYPNPFNPITHIDFMLKESTNVILKVFNALGQEIKTLVDEEMIPGYYSRIFNGKDLPSGVYLYQLKVNDFSQTRKMILMK